jgi:hypothetical protein
MGTAEDITELPQEYKDLEKACFVLILQFQLEEP